mgnify:CR=1 FL=1
MKKGVIFSSFAGVSALALGCAAFLVMSSSQYRDPRNYKILKLNGSDETIRSKLVRRRALPRLDSYTWRINTGGFFRDFFGLAVPSKMTEDGEAQIIHECKRNVGEKYKIALINGGGMGYPVEPLPHGITRENFTNNHRVEVISSSSKSLPYKINLTKNNSKSDDETFWAQVKGECKFTEYIVKYDNIDLGCTISKKLGRTYKSHGETRSKHLQGNTFKETYHFAARDKKSLVIDKFNRIYDLKPDDLVVLPKGGEEVTALYYVVPEKGRHEVRDVSAKVPKGIRGKELEKWTKSKGFLYSQPYPMGPKTPWMISSNAFFYASDFDFSNCFISEKYVENRDYEKVYQLYSVDYTEWRKNGS